MQTQNEEMIGVLTAMSIVAERLAKQLQKQEEGNKDEKEISRSSKEYEKSSR